MKTSPEICCSGYCKESLCWRPAPQCWVSHPTQIPTCIDLQTPYFALQLLKCNHFLVAMRTLCWYHFLLSESISPGKTMGGTAFGTKQLSNQLWASPLSYSNFPLFGTSITWLLFIHLNIYKPDMLLTLHHLSWIYLPQIYHNKLVHEH
jgi:hypothetical protein